MPYLNLGVLHGCLSALLSRTRLVAKTSNGLRSHMTRETNGALTTNSIAVLHSLGRLSIAGIQLLDLWP
jgi:hypothetical protein